MAGLRDEVFDNLERRLRRLERKSCDEDKTDVPQCHEPEAVMQGRPDARSWLKNRIEEMERETFLLHRLLGSLPAEMEADASQALCNLLVKAYCR